MTDAAGGWTKGPVDWDGPPNNIHVFKRDHPHMRVCFMTSDGPTEANATLIAEAFNVSTETGLSPRQLAEAVERLSAALKSQTGRTWEEIERADKADHMRVAIETGKVHPALAIDVQEHRQQAYQNGWNEGYAEGFGKVTQDRDQLANQNTTLKRELGARAIRTMGPRSPFWNCTLCGAAHQTPIGFTHKPKCLLADEPNPAALITGEHRSFYSIEAQLAERTAQRDELLTLVTAVKHDAEYPDDLGDMIDAALARTTRPAAKGEG